MTEESQCPNCGKQSFLVIESRVNLDGRRRRRACSDCKYRETVYEITEVAYAELKHMRTQLNRVLRALNIATSKENDITDFDKVEPLCVTCVHNKDTKCVWKFEKMYNKEASLDCERYSRKIVF